VIDFQLVQSSISGDLAEVRERVGAALRHAAELAGVGGVFEAESLGKQLRSATLILVSRLFGGDRPLAVRLAADVELIHEASLIHDDVLDEAPTRRGRPSAASVLGPSDAVLLGDVIFMDVFRDAVEAGVPGALEEITRAAAQVVAGEVRQHRRRGDFSMSRREYLRIVDLKTASLYRACAVLGALTGGAERDAAAAAGRFGRWMGMAFQVADDLLDVQGDAAEAGKPVQKDLADGRVTLPAIVYLEGLDERGRQAAAKRLAARDERFIEEALLRMAEPANVVAARRVAAVYCRRALKTLDALPVGLERLSLAALCRFAADRTY
jgi:geranylgeranyl pyrophosphate synthase